MVPAQEIKMIGRAAAIKDPEGAVLGLISSKFPLPDEPENAPPGSIVWNELLASSPQGAAKFYRSLSNAEVELIERRGGEYRLLLSAGIKHAGIVKKPVQNLSPVWLAYFSVSDPEQAAERAKALGGEILIPASSGLREGSMAVISDPTGALLVLQKNTL